MGASWPLASSYLPILQNPELAFRDKQLQRCTITRDANNQPLGITGSSALVCHATLPDGQQLAIRAFTSDRGNEFNERYHVVYEYLNRRTPLKSLVSFQYHDKGIRAITGGLVKFYPLMTMDWVSGVTLYEWVRDRCQEHDKRRLTGLADRWVELVAELNDAQIAHGDLSDSNVMVTEQDDLKLVDYDGMCVPNLVGLENMEIGLQPYQHPDRDANTKLSTDLDNFSAIFILVALRALAAAPNLWIQYVEQSYYDKLLIRREDFDDPGQSSLYRALQSSPDPNVRSLSRYLFELWRVKMDEVPRLTQTPFSND
jgi:hypothetical protein